jgi:hypothetical protein
MSSPVSYDLQGQGGGQVLTTGEGSTQTASNVRWVQCLTDCVFDTVNASNLAESGTIEGKTIPAGVGFGGRFELVVITSGLAIAYYL